MKERPAFSGSIARSRARVAFGSPPEDVAQRRPDPLARHVTLTNFTSKTRCLVDGARSIFNDLGSSALGHALETRSTCVSDNAIARLFVFNQFGDLKRCALRPGNVRSSVGWREVLEPVGRARGGIL
jgi:hypothetical protein